MCIYVCVYIVYYIYICVCMHIVPTLSKERPCVKRMWGGCPMDNGFPWARGGGTYAHVFLIMYQTPVL